MTPKLTFSRHASPDVRVKQTVRFEIDHPDAFVEVFTEYDRTPWRGKFLGTAVNTSSGQPGIVLTTGYNKPSLRMIPLYLLVSIEVLEEAP